MPRRAAVLLLLLLGMPAIAAAQRTDIVVLGNGDRITGEVVRLERGRLEFKTDEAGTLYIEWDNINRVEARRTFEVGTSDGRRFLGRLEPGTPRTLSVGSANGTVTLPVIEVTLISPVGASFWRKLDGSFDAGFNYTQSSGVAQLNVNSETVFRRPRFEARMDLSLNATAQQADGSRDDRASFDASYVRFRGARWMVGIRRPFRDQRESRAPAALAGRHDRRPAPGQLQPRPARLDRRARGQQRTGGRCRVDEQCRSGARAPVVVLHLRPAAHRVERVVPGPIPA